MHNFHSSVKLALYESVVVGIASVLANLFSESELSKIDILVILVLHFIVFYFSKIYINFGNRGHLVEFEQTLNYSFMFVGILMCSSFMLKNNFQISRREIMYFSVFNFVLIYITNSLLRKFKNIFLFSTKYQAQTLVITSLERLSHIQDLFATQLLQLSCIRAVVLIGDTTSAMKFDIPILSCDEAVEFATREVVDHVFIDLPNVPDDLKSYITEFEFLGIDVSINISACDFELLKNKRIQQIGKYSVVTFSSNLHKTSHILLKRLLDITGAIIGLLICGIVGIVLVPLIRRDGGSAIFVQKRVGRNGRIFKFYKFRSMYVDAETHKQGLLMYNQMQGGMFKMDNDPRITPIGNFIRRTSLDELPQFYNVLMGDMSLVGTRPPTVDEFETYTPTQKRRLSFRPGITGLWQVSGRSDITDFDDVVKLDLEYIDTWSIWVDIKIILKTIKVVFLKEGAR